MKYLIALDLEGVAGVVGYPYEGLSKGTEEYNKATAEAVIEVNTIARTLLSSGANEVLVWDNHGGGDNIDFSLLDERINRFPSFCQPFDRMGQARTLGLDGIFLVGYHSREGTLGGVLAHTMSSKDFLYHSLNGKRIGEIEQDGYIAGSFGIPLLMVVSDDKGCLQAREFSPDTVTVCTKTGISRNKAILRSSSEVNEELVEATKKAVSVNVTPITLSFPSTLEVSYSRTETAETAREKFLAKTNNNARFTVDARTVEYEITDMFSFEVAMWGR